MKNLFLTFCTALLWGVTVGAALGGSAIAWERHCQKAHERHIEVLKIEAQIAGELLMMEHSFRGQREFMWFDKLHEIAVTIFNERGKLERLRR